MKKGGGGGGDMTLESRHLIGVFLGVVVLCSVFFTLGYVMRSAQEIPTVRAAGPSSNTAAAVNPSPVLAKPGEKLPAKPAAVPSAPDWTYPTAGDPKKPADRLEPVPKPVASAPVNVAAKSVEKTAASPAPKAVSSKARAPVIPHGSTVLQVAALSRESDALALAEALQQKKYPAFVLTPAAGDLYRVQVGPFKDAVSADTTKKALLADGFKAIIKR